MGLTEQKLLQIFNGALDNALQFCNNRKLQVLRSLDFMPDRLLAGRLNEKFDKNFSREFFGTELEVTNHK